MQKFAIDRVPGGLRRRLTGYESWLAGFIQSNAETDDMDSLLEFISGAYSHQEMLATPHENKLGTRSYVGQLDDARTIERTDSEGRPIGRKAELTLLVPKTDWCKDGIDRATTGWTSMTDGGGGIWELALNRAIFDLAKENLDARVQVTVNTRLNSKGKPSKEIVDLRVLRAAEES